MYKISLDTNAMLDLCYRFYPKSIFANVWSCLLIQMQQHHFAFYLSSTNKNECIKKIEQFDYDQVIFDDFISTMKVQVIERDDFGDSVIYIQKTLHQHPSFAKSIHATRPEEDVDMIALARHIKGAALTSERGFGKENHAKQSKSRPKIPDICELVNIKCTDWVTFFGLLGMRFD
ncbi:MAG: DUF4411 family protein [Pseudomonadales bacterium]|nr:DUF4411 family protein [Pseudomonadales bacterium]